VLYEPRGSCLYVCYRLICIKQSARLTAPTVIIGTIQETFENAFI